MSTPAFPHRTGIRGFVRRHPLSSFFGLAYGLSWLAWLPYVLSADGLGVLDLHYPQVLGSTQLPGIGAGGYLGPLTAAFVVTALADGRAGLRHWTARLTRWRVGWRWYAGVLTGVPTAILLATLVLPGALGGATVPALAVLAAYLPMMLLQMVTTSTAEEPGWRDFALPRLQDRHGPLLGTIVLGLLWGCWHLPLFLTADWGHWPDVSWTEPVEFVAMCVPLSIVMTWVFNRTHQSLPIVMVLHAGVNSVMSLVWPAVFPHLDWQHDASHALLIACVAATVVLALATRGRLGLQSPPRPEPAPARHPDPLPVTAATS
jgi:uncharacterized protein